MSPLSLLKVTSGETHVESETAGAHSLTPAQRSSPGCQESRLGLLNRHCLVPPEGIGFTWSALWPGRLSFGKGPGDSAGDQE